MPAAGDSLSKLPDVGTTIFTSMSRRARELGAVNVGQGFPDYDIDPRLVELVAAAMAAGYNQYAPMEGTGELREQIAKKLAASYRIRVDPESQITITLGATEALFSTIQAVVSPGDEVIVFDPVYDSYEPAVRLAGGKCIRLPLLPPKFLYDWDEVREALTDRTRLVIFNNPHNPTCTVAGETDLRALAEIVRDRDIHVLADEVYEHVVFDGRRHASVLAHPELAARSCAVFSFGKTLHATGLRVGYAVAPAGLTRELRKVHQFNTFSIAHPFQYAITNYLQERPDLGQTLAGFFQAKRDYLCDALRDSSFDVPPAQGTYFQLIDFGALSGTHASAVLDTAAAPPDVAFAERLLMAGGVATIPLSPFYETPPKLSVVRLCLAKRDATLLAAAQRLCVFAGGSGRG